MGRFLVGVLVWVFAGSGALAEEQSYSWQGELLFDAAVPVPGGTLGSLLAEISGRDDLNGRMPVSGQIIYDDAIPPTSINMSVAGYRDAVTQMTLQFGVVPLQADMARIAQNADTSRVGMLAMENGGFCADFDHCQVFGLTNPNWGNQMVMINNTEHFWVEQDGLRNDTGDAFGPAVGRTDAPAEFLPQIQTQAHGVVAVDGLYVGLFTAPGQGFFDNHDTLPPIETFRDWALVGRTEIVVFLDLPGAAQPLRIDGIVHSIDIPG